MSTSVRRGWARAPCSSEICNEGSPCDCAHIHSGVHTPDCVRTHTCVVSTQSSRWVRLWRWDLCLSSPEAAVAGREEGFLDEGRFRRQDLGLMEQDRCHTFQNLWPGCLPALSLSFHVYQMGWVCRLVEVSAKLSVGTQCWPQASPDPSGCDGEGGERNRGAGALPPQEPWPPRQAPEGS